MGSLVHRLSDRDMALQEWKPAHLEAVTAKARAEGLLTAEKQLMLSCAITTPRDNVQGKIGTEDNSRAERSIRILLDREIDQMAARARATGILEPHERITYTYIICPSRETISP